MESKIDGRVVLSQELYEYRDANRWSFGDQGSGFGNRPTPSFVTRLMRKMEEVGLQMEILLLWRFWGDFSCCMRVEG